MDDPGNAHFRSPIQVLLRMITDVIRKAMDEYGLPRMMPDCMRV